jgi:hypothetical protein
MGAQPILPSTCRTSRADISGGAKSERPNHESSFERVVLAPENLGSDWFQRSRAARPPFRKPAKQVPGSAAWTLFVRRTTMGLGVFRVFCASKLPNPAPKVWAVGIGSSEAQRPFQPWSKRDEHAE